MRLLIDTNILMEILLDQERSGEAMRPLSRTDLHDFFLSDYSLHSIGILLLQRGQSRAFSRFVHETILQGAVRLLLLGAEDMEAVVECAERFGLDFDDAYQYVTAQRNALVIVSFDGDFDATDSGRKAPADVL